MTDVKAIASVTGLDFDAIELRILALIQKERERFEAVFEPDEHNRGGLKQFRDGEGYVHWSHYLNGAWWGWQQKARFTGNDPFVGFVLEAANEGELAAYDYGCRSAEDAVRRVLEGDDTWAGSTNEPWASLRNQLLRLKADAERWRKMNRLSFKMPAFRTVVISLPAETQEAHDKTMNEWMDGL